MINVCNEHSMVRKHNMHLVKVTYSANGLELEGF